MANPSDGLDIPIKVQTTGDGGKEGADGIKRVREETAASAPVIRDYATATETAANAEEKRAAAEKKRAEWQREGNNGGGGLASDPGAFMAEQQAAAAEKEATEKAKTLATEERRQAILVQRQALIATETEARLAEAAGDTAHAAALDREVALLREALVLQQQAGLSEAEALIIAEQRVAAEETRLLIDREQEILNRRLIAEEEAQLFLERQQTTEKARQAQIDAQMLRTSASAVGGKLGLGNLGAGLAGGIGGLAAIAALDLGLRGVIALYKQFTTAAEEAGEASQDAGKEFAGLTTQANLLMSALAPKGFAAKLKKELEEAAGAYDKVASAATAARRAQDELADAQLAAGMADIDAQEANEMISASDASARRSALRLGAERSKLDRADAETRTKVSAAGSEFGTADLRAEDAKARAEAARAAQQAAFEAASQAGVAGVTPDQLRAKSAAVNASITGESGTEDVASARRQQAVLAEQIALAEKLMTARRARVVAENAETEAAKIRAAAEQRFTEANTAGRQSSSINQVRRRQLGSEGLKAEGQARTSAYQDDRRARDERDEDAARQDAARQKRAREQAAAAQQAFYEDATPDQRAQAVGQNADSVARRYAGDGTVTSGLAQNVRAAAAKLNDGAQGDEMAELLAAVQDLLEVGRVHQQDREGLNRNVQLLQREVETLKNQAKNSKS